LQIAISNTLDHAAENRHEHEGANSCKPHATFYNGSENQEKIPTIQKGRPTSMQEIKMQKQQARLPCCGRWCLKTHRMDEECV
jgi:hypothetical protein